MEPRGFLIILSLWAGAALLAAVRHPPPAALPAEAPDDVFSAGRALAVLERLVGDGVPHPIGTDANRAMRQRVIAEFDAIGYGAQVQEADIEPWPGFRYTVRNVMARLEGTGDGPALMLAAHYDSVPAGPGASDDGSGVAIILEIARMLKAGPPPRNDVIFLITDGEEANLLGARAFVDGHPWADEVALVLNLEARGSRGPSLMFQTGTENAWLAAEFARRATRPATGSMFVEIYSRMPNDSDFSIFLDHGMNGLNFAWVGGVEHYHRASDTIANLDPGSLQHQGTNAWAMSRALAERDLSSVPPGKAVYFDVLRAFVVWWPQGLTLWLALTGVGAVGAATAILIRRGSLRPGRLAWTALIGLTAAVAIVAAGGVLRWLLVGTGAVSWRWVSHPAPAVAAFWALGLAGAAAYVRLCSLRASAWEIWGGVWAWWALAGLFLTVVAPGAGYLAVVPALAAGLSGLAAILSLKDREPAAIRVATIVPAVVVAIMWFPLEPIFYEGLGFWAPGSVVLVALRAVVILTTLTPMLAEAGSRGQLAVLTTACAALVALVVLASVAPNDLVANTGAS